MAGKIYRTEDDQILINMARKGASNAQIAAVLNRSLRSVEMRRVRLRKDGVDFPNSPRTRIKKADKPEQVCFEVTDVGAQSAVDVEYPEAQFGEVDALELLQVEIDNLNRNEADLLDQLDCVRAEKFNISMKLNGLLEALNTVGTLVEDPA